MLFSANLHNSSIVPAMESNILGIRDPVLYLSEGKKQTLQSLEKAQNSVTDFT